MPNNPLIVPRPTVSGSYLSTGYGVSSVPAEMLYDGHCDSCNQMIYPSYTDDAPNGIPELFEINAISRVMRLCTDCLVVLEDAIHAAIVDRLVIRDGGAA